jgi:hypothetical protein
MIRGSIDLQYVISEEDGSASISRLQLLIFTLVIALSYFLLVICGSKGTSCAVVLPDIPSGVLALLGISGGNYLLSKGVQKTWEYAKGSPAGTTSTPPTSSA